MRLDFNFPARRNFSPRAAGWKISPCFSPAQASRSLLSRRTSHSQPSRKTCAPPRSCAWVRSLENFLAHRGAARRIAVAGLNPHAGESGALGREEIEIIAPAIAELNRSSLITRHSSHSFSGPFSPDTVFHRAVAGEFDAVLCMYHDQGLIPLKLHAFHEGVNVTLGLPFPRTSPDHGTAFAIAGQGIARADSMIAAIRLASRTGATDPV